MVKDAEFRVGGGRGMARGGKVNSFCCRVHKNAEFVPDSAGIRMYVCTHVCYIHLLYVDICNMHVDIDICKAILSTSKASGEGF